MRDIKFRAWNGKKMVGDEKLVFWNGNTYLNESGTLNDPAKPYSPAKLKGYTVLAVMQFTGLTDKNGKEIFEGDILGGDSNIDGSPEMVVFHEPELQWSVQRISDKRMFELWYRAEECGELEIIGNIYENPELLTN